MVKLGLSLATKNVEALQKALQVYEGMKEISNMLWKVNF